MPTDNVSWQSILNLGPWAVIAFLILQIAYLLLKGGFTVELKGFKAEFKKRT